MKTTANSRAVATFCFMASLGHVAGSDAGLVIPGYVQAEAPDIAGTWSGADWGTVTLRADGKGAYRGTYTDTFGKAPGSIELKWSAREQRFMGRWAEGKKRFGTISVQGHQDGTLLGAWTADPACEVRPAVPALSGLLWKRGEAERPAIPDPAPEF